MPRRASTPLRRQRKCDTWPCPATGICTPACSSAVVAHASVNSAIRLQPQHCHEGAWSSNTTTTRAGHCIVTH
eukprot:1930826-Rhodomonas_salina.1